MKNQVVTKSYKSFAKSEKEKKVLNNPLYTHKARLSPKSGLKCIEQRTPDTWNQQNTQPSPEANSAHRKLVNFTVN